MYSMKKEIIEKKNALSMPVKNREEMNQRIR